MIRIIVDTAANLPKEIRERMGIIAIPMYVAFGNRSFRDEVELSNEMFLRMLEEGKHNPTTSQPSPADFVDIFRPVLENGNEIIAITLSAKLSGTYSSAVAAKEMLDPEYHGQAPISIVDTPFVSMGDGFLALRAVEMAQDGVSRDQIVTNLGDLMRRINILFLLPTLEFLRRGGRIGRAQAFVGGVLLNVKPLLEIKDGAVEPLERARSRQAGLRRLVEIMQERMGDGNVHVAILHFGASTDALAMEADIRSRLKIDECIQAEIGPVIAVHGGPGMIGVVFYKD
jgi:DegV family protein with EDD domain